MSFERIQYYYEAGLWSKPMVKMAVRKGVITREQYRDITGEDYRAQTLAPPAERARSKSRRSDRPK